MTHQRDKAPDDSLIKNKKYFIQWMANISMILGIIPLIGIVFSFILGTGIFIISAIIGLGFAITAINLSQQHRIERARWIAVVGLTLNSIVIFISIIIGIFFKEIFMTVG